MFESELETRLVALGAELGAEPSRVELVAREIQQRGTAPRRSRARRWLVPSMLSLAAAVIAVACCLTLGSRATPAFGMDELVTALSKVKSMHVKGKIFNVLRPGRRVESPTEFFVERPCRRWIQGCGISDDKAPQITYYAHDGKLSKHVDPDKRTFAIKDDNPLLAELAVEGMFQQMLFEGLRGGQPSQFRKVGEERINGRWCDRYEGVQLGAETWPGSGKYSGDKSVVWLDPTSGLPVRLASYSFDGPSPDDLVVSVIEDIEFNVAPRPEMFDFEPPAGYQVADLRGKQEPPGFSSSSGNFDECTGIGPPALNIDDRAVLICWAAYDVSQTPYLEPEIEGPPGRIIPPGKFRVESGLIKYHLVFVRTDAAKDFHWRWSLLVPVGPDRQIGDDSPTLRMNGKGGGSMNLGFSGLRFQRERLERLVVEVQRLTLPPDAPPDAAFTLPQIEALIDQVHER
jgi:hypothetical protein